MSWWSKIRLVIQKKSIKLIPTLKPLNYEQSTLLNTIWRLRLIVKQFKCHENPNAISLPTVRYRFNDVWPLYVTTVDGCHYWSMLTTVSLLLWILIIAFVYGPCLTKVNSDHIQKVQKSCLRFTYGIRERERVAILMGCVGWTCLSVELFMRCVSIIG